MHPNPARATAEVVVARPATGEGGGHKVAVFDALGRLVAEMETDDGRVRLDTLSWPSRVYVVLATTTGSSVSQQATTTFSVVC